MESNCNQKKWLLSWWLKRPAGLTRTITRTELNGIMQTRMLRSIKNRFLEGGFIHVDISFGFFWEICLFLFLTWNNNHRNKRGEKKRKKKLYTRRHPSLNKYLYNMDFLNQIHCSIPKCTFISTKEETFFLIDMHSEIRRKEKCSAITSLDVLHSVQPLLFLEKHTGNIHSK